MEVTIGAGQYVLEGAPRARAVAGRRGGVRGQAARLADAVAVPEGVTFDAGELVGHLVGKPRFHVGSGVVDQLLRDLRLGVHLMGLDAVLADLRGVGVVASAHFGHPASIGLVVVHDAFQRVGADGHHVGQLAHGGLLIHLLDHAAHGGRGQQVAAIGVGTGGQGLALVGAQALDVAMAHQRIEGALVLRVGVHGHLSGNAAALGLEVGAQHGVPLLALGFGVFAALGCAGALRFEDELVEVGLQLGQLVHFVAELGEFGFQISDSLAFGLRLQQFVVGFLVLFPGFALGFNQRLDFEDVGHGLPFFGCKKTASMAVCGG